MKKLCAVSILLVVLSTAAFAQVKEGITIGAWGRVAWAPLIAVQENTEDGYKEEPWAEGNAYAGLGVNWGAHPRVRVDINGTNPEKSLGFKLQIRSEGTFGLSGTGLTGFAKSFDVGDFASIWAKPFGNDYLKLELGHFNDDTLRGKIGDTDYHNFVTAMKDQDSIFHRFQGRTGAIVSSAPIEGLWLGIKADFAPLLAGSANGTLASWWKEAPKSGTWDNGSGTYGDNFGDTENVYDYIQFGVGYVISGVGHARAQIIGNTHAPDGAFDYQAPEAVTPSTIAKNANEIGVAFAFTGVDGLLVDFGVKIPIGISDEIEVGSKKIELVYQKPFHFGLGANFTTGDFGILGRVDGDFAGNITAKEGDLVDKEGIVWQRPEFNIHLVPSYNLGFAVVGLDLGFVIYGDTDLWEDGKTIDDYKASKGGVDFGFGPWIQKKVSNGSIKAGIAYKVPTTRYANLADDDGVYDDTKTQGVFTIPIILEYSF
jgi:hypothetical protein